MSPFELRPFEEEWENFLRDLEKVLPAPRRKEIILKALRRQYAWAREKAPIIADKYDEAVKAGLPYAERRFITKESEVLERAKEEIVRRGRMGFDVGLSWIDPSFRQEIESMGPEEWFRKRWQLACG